MIIKPVVKNWLLLGAILVFFQIFIGGVTRLTGSGLSITKWDIIFGTFPPISAEAWMASFDLYAETPQYKMINEGMSMSEFKFIFFWEYFHRLWARMMGFVFLFPLILFTVKSWIPRRLIPNLIGMFLGAAIVAVFGWIMVASGLVERPWVNAYKLSVHLGLALILYCFILYAFFREKWLITNIKTDFFTKGKTSLLLALISVQIILGAWMSGMKAALNYPTWPDMHGEIIPKALSKPGVWKWANVLEYDGLTSFMPAFVQFTHRYLGYILFFLIIYFYIKGLKRVNNLLVRRSLHLLFITCLVQVCLGILTLVSSIGSIPVGLGSAHQVVAIVLLSIVLFLFFSAFHKPRDITAD